MTSTPLGLRVFQSTPPVKAATFPVSLSVQSAIISIHAAREGGDYTDMVERNHNQRFQSTPPVKAATIGAD